MLEAKADPVAKARTKPMSQTKAKTPAEPGAAGGKAEAATGTGQAGRVRELAGFGASSLIAACIDFTLVLLLKQVTGQLALAVVGARLASATANYLLNRLVFSARQAGHKSAGTDRAGRKSARRYALTAGAILTLNYLLLNALHEGLALPLAAAKLLTEALLWLLSYWLQRQFVFAAGRRQGDRR